MSKDPNELLNEMFLGKAEILEDAPELDAAFLQMDQAAYVEGELERKYKELIGLAIALYTRCDYCLTQHVKQALNEGANRDEILEAAAVAVAFGGSPAMSCLSTTLKRALDEFE
ncbi:MAG: carboxymuconolactone decarboxylase family protein [Syntrophomonadaceae bacterium]